MRLLNKILLLIVVIMLVLSSISCTSPENIGIGKKFLFSLEPDNQAKVEAIIEEFKKTAMEEDRLSAEIFDLPLITGDAKEDERVIANMHDIVLKGLALEQRSATSYLRSIAIQKQAYLLQQKKDGKKKLLGPKEESLFIKVKDKILLRYLRSVNREYAELRKKLGYKLLVRRDGPKGAKISTDLLFSLDAEALADVEQLIFTIRMASVENDRLSKEINKLSFHNSADRGETVSKMVDLVMQGLILEEKFTTAFLKAVQIQHQAYLQKQKDGGKKVLTEEQELLFIGMKNDVIESYERSLIRELDELMKKLFW